MRAYWSRYSASCVDVELEPCLIQRAGGEFAVERQGVDRRPQVGGALPGVVAEAGHAMLFDAISNVLRDRLGQVEDPLQFLLHQRLPPGVEAPPLPERRDHPRRDLAVGRVELDDGVGVSR